MAKRGVIMFEGDWSADLRDRMSVQPLLEMVRRAPQIDTIYRDIGTVEELEHYVRAWTRKRYEHYRVGIFAFRGQPGAINIGRKTYSLEQLAESLGDRALAGKSVFFGSCAVMEDEASVRAFQAATKANVVCGYTEDVDWFKAAAFELLFLDAFTWFKTPRGALNYLAKEHGSFARQLGFRSVPSWRSKPKPRS